MDLWVFCQAQPGVKPQTREAINEFQNDFVGQWLNVPERQRMLAGWFGSRIREVTVNVTILSEKAQPAWKSEIRGKRTVEIDLVISEGQFESILKRASNESQSQYLAKQLLLVASGFFKKASDDNHVEQKSRAQSSGFFETLTHCRAHGSVFPETERIEKFLRKNSDSEIAAFWVEQSSMAVTLQKLIDENPLLSEPQMYFDGQYPWLVLAAGETYFEDFINTGEAGPLLTLWESAANENFDVENFWITPINILGERNSRLSDLLKPLVAELFPAL